MRGQQLRTSPSAAIVLEAEESGEVQLRFSYVVDGPTWSPSYTATPILDQDAGNTPTQLHIEYHASITQDTGEDWSNVELVLSTTVGPALDGPVLPHESMFMNPPVQPAQSSVTVSQNSSVLAVSQVSASGPTYAPSTHFESSTATNWLSVPSPIDLPLDPSISQPQQPSITETNPIASSPTHDPTPQSNLFHENAPGHEIQNIAQKRTTMSSSNTNHVGQLVGLAAAPEPPTTEGTGSAVAHAMSSSVPEIGADVIYREGQVSIPSGSSTERVIIQRLTLDAQFTWGAVPRVQDGVTLDCRIKNNSNSVLLSGPCIIALDPSITVESFIPDVRQSEPFSLKLSVADAIKVSTQSQELGCSYVGTSYPTLVPPSGGVRSFSRKTTVANMLQFPVNLVLRDQLPYSTNPNVKVKLLKPSEGPMKPITEGYSKEGDKGTNSLGESGHATTEPGVTVHLAPRNGETAIGPNGGFGVEWHCVGLKPQGNVEADLAWEVSAPQGYPIAFNLHF
ncbi:hypothetical protein DL93DRAFT_1750774 [Clavulina sp. PMI_390]|nr:hypothetical protein DL93DRAFT_1750774 [Clavulina sp. PMI_390]